MSETARRYRLLDDDEGVGLYKGDIVVGLPCRPESGSDFSPDHRVFVLYREADGHEPGCNQYWYNLKRLRGRVHIGWDPENNKWHRAAKPKPRSRKKRWQQHAATSRR